LEFLKMTGAISLVTMEKQMKRVSFLIFIGMILASLGAGTILAEVTHTCTTGFQVKQVREINADSQRAFEIFVTQFHRWYDANHSYSGHADNLSLDLEQRCMLERLPEGGFVRHLEMVFYQPGKVLRLSGGLGPLQGMGVSGALTFEFQPVEGAPGKTQVTLTYNVSGSEFLQLEQLAQPVDAVLGMQLDRFSKHVTP
jgi:hypothetical protein